MQFLPAASRLPPTLAATKHARLSQSPRIFKGSKYQRVGRSFPRLRFKPDTETDVPTSDAETTARTLSEGTWDRDEWFSAYEDAVESPSGYWMKIEGELPSTLRGTYFRNGPGRWNDGGEDVLHPYDSEGLVASISIKNGRAFFRSRFVETKESQQEEAKGQKVYKGAFGTVPNAARKNFDVYVKNASNSAVFLWGPKLWTLYESGQPYLLDPYTLRTVGLDNLDGVFHEGLPFDLGLGRIANSLTGALLQVLKRDESFKALVGGDAVCAHPRVDPKTNRLVIFSYRLKLSHNPSLISTELTFYEFDQKFNLVNTLHHTFPGYAFVHDFGLTENYYVVIEAHLISRPSSDSASKSKAQIIKMQPSFCFHHVNAYEEDSTVVLDSIHYPRFPDFHYMLQPGKGYKDIDADQQPIGRLKRMVLDLEKREGTLTEKNFRAMEFPGINAGFEGSPYKYTYVSASLHPHKNQPGQAIAKVNVDSGAVEMWSAGTHYYVGEPEFVSNYQGIGAVSEVEDDGWILCMCYDSLAQRSELVVLNARRVIDGPVAVLPLEGKLPHGLHGCWSGKYFGP
ncbi:hypothetical protein BSKO_09033 [Bryopsis sp. KO-2023]|nr:hypothetical protein BSKO_09033 [Bryopsis sp. KO-2023]